MWLAGEPGELTHAQTEEALPGRMRTFMLFLSYAASLVAL